MILKVLKSDNVEVSAKFRYWARKTFVAVRIESVDFVCNKQLNLPVIIHDDIYERLSECYHVVDHSSWDKTWAEVVLTLI